MCCCCWPRQILTAPLTPNESFLRYLTLPQDNELAIDLRQTAVVIMAHLDRLAAPCSPPQCSSPTSHKVPTHKTPQELCLLMINVSLLERRRRGLKIDNLRHICFIFVMLISSSIAVPSLPWSLFDQECMETKASRTIATLQIVIVE